MLLLCCANTICRWFITMSKFTFSRPRVGVLALVCAENFWNSCYYNFFAGHSKYRSKQKSCADPFQGLCSPPVPSRSLAEPVRPSPEIQAAAVQPPRVNVAEVPPTGFLSMFRCLALPTNMKVETTCCIFAVYYCTTHLFCVRLFLSGCMLFMAVFKPLNACLIRGLFWGGIGLFEVVQVNPLFGYQSYLIYSCW